MKLLTASEWPGMAFTMALMIHTEEGFKLFSKVCKQRMKASQIGGASYDDECGAAMLDQNNLVELDPVDLNGDEEENLDEVMDEADLLED